MKRTLNYLFLMAFLLLNGLYAIAQETNDEKKLSYYEQRAREDAKFEQTLEMAEDEEEDFWQEQKVYEKDLKKRDKQAYKAYMKGKRDAYAEHAKICNEHCHHSHDYHSHVTFYYYREYPSYRPYQYNTRVNAGVRVNTPSVRIGF